MPVHRLMSEADSRGGVARDRRVCVRPRSIHAFDEERKRPLRLRGRQVASSKTILLRAESYHRVEALVGRSVLALDPPRRLACLAHRAPQCVERRVRPARRRRELPNHLVRSGAFLHCTCNERRVECVIILADHRRGAFEELRDDGSEPNGGGSEVGTVIESDHSEAELPRRLREQTRSEKGHEERRLRNHGQQRRTVLPLPSNHPPSIALRSFEICQRGHEALSNQCASRRAAPVQAGCRAIPADHKADEPKADHASGPSTEIRQWRVLPMSQHHVEALP